MIIPWVHTAKRPLGRCERMRAGSGRSRSPTCCHRYSLPKSPEVQLCDLFGNPRAAGTAIDNHVSYVVPTQGLAKLQAALGVQ